MENKVCRKCEIEKSLDCFALDKSRIDGRGSKCKQCYSDWYFENKSERRRVAKEWYQKNKIQEREKNKKRYDKNKDCNNARSRDWYKKNKNKKSVKQHRAQYMRKKRSNDVNFRISCNLRARVKSKINKNQKVNSTIDLLGCSVEELRIHLEAQFVEGMNCENYGLYGWHIDHIRPCSSFDLTDAEQQRICFHYTNMQPLWAKDNLKKSDKFQVQTHVRHRLL